MRVWHLTQRGRSIGESKLSVEAEVMRLTCDTAGARHSQPPALPKDGTVIR
jgi:hypothetical protein